MISVLVIYFFVTESNEFKVSRIEIEIKDFAIFWSIWDKKLFIFKKYFYSIGDYYRKRVYDGDFLRATLNGKEWSVPCKGCVVGLVGSFALFLTACSGQRRSWSFEECMNLVGYTYYAHCAHAPKIFSLFNRFNHMLPRFKHETQDLFYQYSFLNLTNKPFLPQFPFTEPSRIIEFKTLQSNHLYINV